MTKREAITEGILEATDATVLHGVESPAGGLRGCECEECRRLECDAWHEAWERDRDDRWWEDNHPDGDY